MFFAFGALAGLMLFALPENPAVHALQLVYIWSMGAYLALTCVSSFSVNPLMWLVAWVGVVLSHLWYGFRFAHGLLAGKAPCEFIGKDHATHATEAQ